MVNITGLSQWLTTTVPGILILGAFGSILGGIIIYVVRLIFQRAPRLWKFVQQTVLYPYVREIEIGERLAEAAPELDDSQDLQLFMFWGFCEVVIFSGWVGLAVTFTSGVAVLYGLSRPMLLAFSISVTLLLCGGLIRTGLRYVGAFDTRAGGVEEELERTLPKTYRHWRFGSRLSLDRDREGQPDSDG